MNRAEHIATTAAEECNEVAQRISKALRFGWEEVQPGQPLTNAERVAEEYRDLTAMMHMLVGEGLIQPDFAPNSQQIINKISKVERFMQIGRDQGALTA